MKKLRLILLVLLVPLLQSAKANAGYSNTEDHPNGTVTMQEYIAEKPFTRAELRDLQKEEKHHVRFETKFKKLFSAHQAKHHSIGSIHDPVDKWFWIWTMGWGLGILITIISGATIASGLIGILWFSFFIIGSVALVIWLIKKFGKH